MILKFQAPVPGEQPNITAGGVATMQMPNGPRIGVLYAELTVTGAAGGAGNVTLPLLTDVAHPSVPLFVKIGGRPCRQRLASELIADNLLQDPTAGGSVAYYQNGNLVGRGRAGVDQLLQVRHQRYGLDQLGGQPARLWP